MKNRSLPIVLLMTIAIATVVSSCRMHCRKGSGTMKAENRKVDDFTKIEISGNFKVHLKQDSSLNLAITADDNLLEDIKTSVQGGTLHVKMKKNICSGGDMTIVIGVRHLESIETSGNDEVTSDDTLHVHDIAISSSGKGKYTLNLNADNVNTQVSGVSEIDLKGQAKSHDIGVSGVGKLHAFDFVVDSYNVATSGMGDYEVNALSKLTIASSGASKVKYKGNPSITNDKSGVSTVEKVN